MLSPKALGEPVLADSSILRIIAVLAGFEDVLSYRGPRICQTVSNSHFVLGLGATGRSDSDPENHPGSPIPRRATNRPEPTKYPVSRGFGVQTTYPPPCFLLRIWPKRVGKGYFLANSGWPQSPFPLKNGSGWPLWGKVSSRVISGSLGMSRCPRSARPSSFVGGSRGTSPSSHVDVPARLTVVAPRRVVRLSV